VPRPDSYSGKPATHHVRMVAAKSSQDVDFLWFYRTQLGRAGRQRKRHKTSKNGGEDAKGPGQGANPFAIEDIGHLFIVSVLSL
jgi:hypothetical protein